MNELIQTLIMMALYLCAVVASSIVDDIVKNGTVRISLIVLIGILTGIAIMRCLTLKVL